MQSFSEGLIISEQVEVGVFIQALSLAADLAQSLLKETVHPCCQNIEALRKDNVYPLKMLTKACKDGLNERNDIYDKLSDINKTHSNVACGKTQAIILELSSRWQAKEREYRRLELLLEHQIDEYEGVYLIF